MSTERSDAVAVKAIGSYDDPGLGDAVRDLLRIERDLEDWLGEGDPARLVVVEPNWLQESHMTRMALG